MHFPFPDVSKPTVALKAGASNTQTPLLGATTPVELQCTDTGSKGLTAATYQWYHTPIGGTKDAISGAASSTLIILDTAIAKTDAGDYFCKITRIASAADQVDESNAFTVTVLCRCLFLTCSV